MRIQSVRIRGFRALRDVCIPIGPLTILIGPNGSGKSSALEALRLFFSPDREVSAEDFWRGSEDNRADEVRIAVTFADLSPEDRTQYETYSAADGTLTIERVFSSVGKGDYLATRLGRPEFADVRRALAGHRERYNALVEAGGWPDLERARSRDDALERMTRWELSHPGDCEPILDPVDFLDLDESQPAAIRARMRLAFIGALEDPQTHVGARTGGAMVELLESTADFSTLRAEIKQASDEAVTRMATSLTEGASAFDAVRERVDRALARFAHGYSIGLAWSTPRAPTPALPEILVSVVDEDGLSPGLSRQGHGIQRSIMFGLLTAQAEIGPSRHSTVVVAIEEPEAFQHPLSARTLARTFTTLSEGSYQVLYSTHSPDLVPADAVAGMRLFTRGLAPDGSGKATTVKVFSLEALRRRMADAMNREDFTTESTKARLRANLDSRVLEGVFSRLVVLVEGTEDAALVRGGAAERNWDLDDAGVAVVEARGKTSIPLLLAFFLEVGVPVYPIFDLDCHNADEQRVGSLWAEQAILYLLSVNSDGPLAETSISTDFTCWREDFGRHVSTEIGDGYSATLAAVCEELGYEAHQARKVAPVIHEVLRRSYAAGPRSESLDQVLDVLRSRAAPS